MWSAMAVARIHGDIPPLDSTTRLNVGINYKTIISQPDEKYDFFTGVVAHRLASYFHMYYIANCYREYSILLFGLSSGKLYLFVYSSRCRCSLIDNLRKN